MALVVPFTYLFFFFGFDRSPVQTLNPSTSTHEQDVSEYGCLTKWKMKKHSFSTKAQ